VAVEILAPIDIFWTNHLENLEALSESVRMRAYGQKDPLIEYKKESFQLFKDLIANTEDWVVANVFKTQADAEGTRNYTENSPRSSMSSQHSFVSTKVGRNDPCPCGSGKKYKKCHGR